MVEIPPSDVLAFRKTVARDNFAIYWQLRRRRPGIEAVSYLKDSVFTRFRGASSDIDLDASLLCVNFGLRVWVEQRGVYYFVNAATIWPDVTTNLPYMHQWEVLRLVHA